MSPNRRLLVILMSNVFFTHFAVSAQSITHEQGEIAGEVTQDSVILQSRLTLGSYPFDDDVPGAPGVARFEIATSRDFSESAYTDWIQATTDNDFIVKAKVGGLQPDTRYYYRLVFGRDTRSAEPGPARSYKTLAGAGAAREASFVVVTGLNYARFQSDYTGPDKSQGFPALETIVRMAPDFFVATGDNIYYDSPQLGRAETQAELRKKWHEQFVRPRFVNLFAQVPTYWEKDDHDFRYNDCDTSGDLEPSTELGISTFLEQVPVVDPRDEDPKTYRTHRITKDLQIWLVEGRDHRSPTMMLDGPDKTIWGSEQKAWLKESLLESDATFKLLISPTPMIGPDDNEMPVAAFEGQDKYKRDNHSNPSGYQTERDEFFRWLLDNDFLEKNFYVVCGDRHWQYHSISPEGIEEFSCGAIIDANSRLGRKPGDPESNDPGAEIRQPYTQSEPSGGFLRIEVKPAREGGFSVAKFTWYDEMGSVLHTTIKTGVGPEN